MLVGRFVFLILHWVINGERERDRQTDRHGHMGRATEIDKKTKRLRENMCLVIHYHRGLFSDRLPPTIARFVDCFPLSMLAFARVSGDQFQQEQQKPFLLFFVLFCGLCNDSRSMESLICFSDFSTLSLIFCSRLKMKGTLKRNCGKRFYPNL